MFNGYGHRKESVQLSRGLTRSIIEAGVGTVFEIYILAVSATKATAKKEMTDKLSILLSSVAQIIYQFMVNSYKPWL